METKVFESVGSFSLYPHRRITVRSKIDGKLGVFDEDTNQFFLPMVYDNIYRGEQHIYVSQNGKEGVLSMNGDVLVPIIWDGVSIHPNEKNGLYVVKKDEKWGIVDSTGNLLIPMKYDFIYGPSNNFAPPAVIVLSKEKFGLIDLNDNIIIPIKYDIKISQLGQSLIMAKRKEDEKYDCYINGELIQDSPFDAYGAWFSTPPIINVSKNGKWGVIDSNDGRIIIPYDYDSINYSDRKNYFYVKKNELVGLFDKYGKVVIPPMWDDIWNPSIGNSQFFRVKKNGVYGLVNANNEFLIPVLYDSLEKTSITQLYRVKKGGEYGIINEKGEVIIPVNYKDLYEIFDLFYGSINGKYGCLDKLGNIAVPFVYDEINSHGEVRLNNQWGIIDKDCLITFGKKKWGDKIITLSEGIEFVDACIRTSFPYLNLACVKKDGKYGFINFKGEVVVPLIYDNAGFPDEDDKVKYVGWVSQGGIQGYVDENGTVIMQKRTLRDKDGRIIYEADISTYNGTFIFTDAKVLITSNNIFIHIDDIIYCERQEGSTGKVWISKLTPDGKIDETVDELSIGSSQHDYYDYMDPVKDRLVIIIKSERNILGREEIVCPNDQSFIWEWLSHYFSHKS